VIQHAYWFGSRAKGEGHSGSDYDLLLETEMELTETQRDLLADIAIDLAA
jgi:predicted nucleotidyltransferase